LSVKDGELQKIFQGHSEQVNAAQFSPDGTLIASGSDDCSVRLWEADSGELIRSLEEHAKPVRFIAFSPAQMQFVSADEDCFRIWDVKQGSSIALKQVHQLSSICYSNDGQLIAAGSRSGLVIVFSLQGEKTCEFQVRGAVNALCFSKDGQFLGAACDNAAIYNF